MKRILELYKRMSIEDALLFLLLLGCLVAVLPLCALMCNLVAFGAVEMWLIFSGISTMLISVTCILLKHKDKVSEIVAPRSLLVVLDFEHNEVKVFEDCPNNLDEEEIENFLYMPDALDLKPGNCNYIYGKNIKLSNLDFEAVRRQLDKDS